MHQIAKSSGFKSSKYDGQFTGVQNSIKSSWAVLVVWSVAESAERCIFHQFTSSRPKGIHAVSKALGRRWHWHVRQWKLTIDGLNPQYLLRILLGSADSPYCLTAFLHWKPCFCHCWGLWKSSYYSILGSALSNDLAACHLHSEMGSSYPPLSLCYCSHLRALVFANLSAHSPLVAGADTQKAVHDWAPHPVYVLLYYDYFQ